MAHYPTSAALSQAPATELIYMRAQDCEVAKTWSPGHVRVVFACGIVDVLKSSRSVPRLLGLF